MISIRKNLLYIFKRINKQFYTINKNVNQTKSLRGTLKRFNKMYYLNTFLKY